MTDNGVTVRRGWVLYDGDCPLCVGWARRAERILLKRGFGLGPLQSPWVKEHLNVEEGERFSEMRLLLTDGRAPGGADALVEISRRIWWAQPFVWLSKVPGALPVLRSAYRWVADRRACRGATSCGIHREESGNTHNLGDYLPMVLLVTAALWFRTNTLAWVFMWCLAFSLYFGCKWLTWRTACRRMPGHTVCRSTGYLLFWPGMDPKAFIGPAGEIPKPKALISDTNSKTHSISGWLWALGKTLSGFVLFWLAARETLGLTPLARGWLGMIGVILILHFGFFELLALWWKKEGVPVEPVMRSPWLSTSLVEFWDKRWNTAFHTLAHRFAFKPIACHWGTGVGTLGVFFISGLVHDAVISLPAGGGFGLPTAYFLAQGAAVLLERSRWGRLLGLGRGLPGWFFTMICTAGPVFWLFHPQFIQNVILPMLNALGAN